MIVLVVRVVLVVSGVWVSLGLRLVLLTLR